MPEDKKTEQFDSDSKKKCFIITPIGNDNTDIRRHIDGLIDECIIPVLEHNYIIEVAHRITTPGSINNQVIESIYEADLVIANLTGLNPNVMYELAFRHSIRKPVILIMEKGEKKLPFDVTTERTIFYDNDFQGAIEFKKNLKSMVESIQSIDKDNIDNPIYSALEKINVKETIIRNISSGESNIDALEYILNRLDNIENKLNWVEINKNSNKRYSKSNLNNSQFAESLIETLSVMNKIILRLDNKIKNKETAKINLENFTSNNETFKDLDTLQYIDDKAIFTTKAYGSKLESMIKEFDGIKEWRIIDVQQDIKEY